MLTSDIQFQYKGSEYRFKAYLSDLTHGGLIRLVAKDGDSAQFLTQNQAESLGRTYRTANFSRASFTVERLMKPKTHFDSAGVDLALPKSFQKHGSFALFAYLYAVYSYAKFLKNESKSTQSVLALSLSQLDDIEDRVEFEVPFGKGVVERKYGLIQKLRFATQEEGRAVSLTFAFVEDESLDFMDNKERALVLGSDVIRMDSIGTAYKTEVSNNLRRQLLGLPKIEVVTDLKGLNDKSFYPFYKTMTEVIEVENRNAKVEQRQPRDFEWVRRKVDSGQYKVVKPHEIDTVFEQLERDYKVIKLAAFDTETDGLDFNFRGFYGHGSKIVGAVLSAKAGTSYYFPLAHKRFENVCSGDPELFVERYLQPFMKDKRIVAHNNMFDWKVGFRHGLIYDCWLDTMVAIRKTYTAKNGDEYGLKAVTDRFLHREAAELDDLAKCGAYNECGGTFDDLEEEVVAFYACPDADNTLCVALYLLENDILGKSGFDMMQAIHNDSRFTCVAAYSEFYGMHLNLESVPQLRLHYGKQLVSQYRDLLEFLAVEIPKHLGGEPLAFQSKAIAKIKELDGDLPKEERVWKYSIEDFPNVVVAPTGYSVNSPKNTTFAYDYLGYPLQTDKKTGNPSMGKNAVKDLLQGTKVDKEPFTESFEDFVAKGKSLLQSWLGQPVSNDSFASLFQDKSLKKLARGLAHVLWVLSEKNWDKWISTDDETLRILAKYLYGSQFGYRTTLIVERDSGILVVPEESAPLHPFVACLASPRDTNRLFTTFLDKVETNFIEGFCFPELDMFKVTGRLSTKKPNIQGFDDTIKKEMTARKGYYMVDTDYASKENRVIAIMSKEKSLIEMFKDWRNDYHRFQSARLNGLLQEQVTDKLRKMSKGLVFGINFGMSDMSLGEVLFGSRSRENAKKAAKKREEFFSFQRSVEGWFDNNVRTALSKGYSTTIFGSKRFYNKDRISKSQIRRYALNHPIQGSAADIYKKGMVDLFSDLKEQGYLGKILLTGFIHDEATIEVHNSIHPHVVLGLIRKNLMVEIEGGCPLDLGFGVGHSWYTAKKTEWQVGLQELMEWNLDAYKWDGNIDDFMVWAENRIHEFNAEDVENKLRSTEFEDTTSEQDRVFPVNYALELNKYLLGELTSSSDSWQKAKGILEFPDGFEKLDKTERKNFIYTHLPDLHIHKRLGLLWSLRQGFDKFVIEEYRDLSDLTNIQESQKESTQAVSTEEDERKKQRERQVQLLKEHLLDFGSKLSSDGSILYVQYSEFLYRELGALVSPLGSEENMVEIILYQPLEDKFIKLPKVGLSQALLTEVVRIARQFVI